MRCVERLASPSEVVHEETGETEIHQASDLHERVADGGRDRRPLFEERGRFREGVPISRHDSQGTEAASELTLQVSHPQDGQAARAELLRLRVVPEPAPIATWSIAAASATALALSGSSASKPAIRAR